MAQIIQASIDLTKIDKSLIQTVNKDGQPFKNGGKYLNVSITINDEENQYGQDTSISTGTSKDDRTYIGNGKTVWRSNAPATPKKPTSEGLGGQVPDSVPDLPF